MSLGVKGETLPVTMSFRVAEASLKMTSFQDRVGMREIVRWITILNLIPSKDGTNLKFQIPCGGGKDFVKGQNFSSFLWTAIGF